MWFANFIMGLPFRHPWLFATGAALVSVPIIIHLLNRRRFRRRPWAAMQFLLESLRKNRRRIQIEELILLLLRCLVLLMLAMAISRFTGCGSGDNRAGGERVPQTIVMLLDDSHSMAQRHGAGTLFSAATADLADQIGKLKKGDVAHVLVASRIGRSDAVLSSEGLVDRLRRLKPSDRRVHLSDALAASADLFAGADGDKVLVLASDFRKADLGTGDEGSRVVRKQLEQLQHDGVEVILLDYGRPGKNNLTIEKLEFVRDAAEAQVAIAGQPIRLAVTVRNNGQAPAAKVDVTVSVRLKSAGEFHDLTRPSVQIDNISPGKSQRKELRIECPEAGSAVVTASIGPDDLEGDNVAHLALDVRKAVRTLLVDGRPDVAVPQNSETFFLRRTFDPNRDASHGNRVDVVSPEGLDGVSLEDYDFVVLADVPDFTEDVTALESYVRGGGGVAIFVGDRANLSFYNGRLYNGGAGLSPYPLLARMGEGGRRDTWFRLAPKSINTDSVFRQFAEDPGVLSILVRFFAFLPADTDTQPIRTPEDVKPPLVIARFDDPNQSPAVVSRSFGRGTILMFYTTASTRWTDWPTDPMGTYVVVMNDMRNYLTRARDEGLVARVGEPLAFAIPDRAPVGASDALRGRASAESARVKPPKTPNTVTIKPSYRFEIVEAELLAAADRIAATDGETAGKIKAGVSVAKKSFRQRELPAASAGLRTVARLLDEWRKSKSGKADPSAQAVVAAARARLLEAIRGAPAELAQRELRYARADEAGIYDVTLFDAAGQKVEDILYARNLDPAEGDLRTVVGEAGATDKREARRALARVIGTEAFRYEQPLEAEEIEDIQAGSKKEYWVWALAAMLVLMALEIFLAQKFGHYTTAGGPQR